MGDDSGLFGVAFVIHDRATLSCEGGVGADCGDPADGAGRADPEASGAPIDVWGLKATKYPATRDESVELGFCLTSPA